MNRTKFLCLTLGLLLCNSVDAESSKDFGQYIVHYNTLPTTSLSKTVAASYGITRSKNRAMLNISVMKKQDDATSHAVAAAISATATNLNNQIKTLNLREIKEQSAIYYIAEFSISNEEVLDFKLKIQPEMQNQHTIRFKKQFFTQ